MSDPTEIIVEKGEPEQVIRDADVGTTPYIVEVKNNPVRFAHKKRQAERGATLTEGQTHTLSNFRGSGIWLAAPEGPAQVRVRPAGASLESQPPKDVAVVDGEINVDPAANLDDVHSQTVVGSDEFTSQLVPDGFGVVYKADVDNNETVEIAGFPLDPGEALSLKVTSVAAVNVSASDATDMTHAVVEVDD